MLIAFSGTHGTGKSTAVYDLAAKLKKETKYNIGILLEVARECPYPINEESTEEAQMWIFTKQIERENEFLKIYDILICDRTLFDSIAYTYMAGYEDLYNVMMRIAKKYTNRYALIHKTNIKERYLIKDGIRTTDKQYQKDIDEILTHIYNELNITLSDNIFADLLETINKKRNLS